ncbi:MAG TPA: spore cortex-lytic protein [Clostridia bacterium]|nr:spore cortex-lytic protein [Clostridia bacterium]
MKIPKKLLNSKALIILTVIIVLGAFLLGLAVPQSQVPEAGAASPYSYEIMLLARLIRAEAEGEPFAGQVGVASVVLNRIRHPSFPHSIASVIFQPHAFESVSRGLIWRRAPAAQHIRAALAALNGWDPTFGALFFWNPAKRVSPWIWTRRIITQIGRHIFAR